LCLTEFVPRQIDFSHLPVDQSFQSAKLNGRCCKKLDGLLKDRQRLAQLSVVNQNFAQVAPRNHHDKPVARVSADPNRFMQNLDGVVDLTTQRKSQALVEKGEAVRKIILRGQQTERLRRFFKRLIHITLHGSLNGLTGSDQPPNRIRIGSDPFTQRGGIHEMYSFIQPVSACIEIECQNVPPRVDHAEHSTRSEISFICLPAPADNIHKPILTDGIQGIFLQ